MMKKCRYILVACMLALLGACASGPKYNEVQSAIPTIPADQGRIYVYRSASMLGGAIQPSVMLNGEKVGDSKPGGFFFVDRAPGNFEVLTSSEGLIKSSLSCWKGARPSTSRRPWAWA